ncbi:MAG: hypothetical protein NW208_01040 [Bryobacter sp.]|nr:hypothetical protein [Bryobacter sp.]
MHVLAPQPMTALAHLSRIRHAGIKIDATEPISLDITGDLMETPLFSPTRGGLGTVRGHLFARWNAGQLPTDPGEYQDLDLLNEPCQVYSRGAYVNARILVSLEVYQSRHFGSFTPDQLAVLAAGNDPEQELDPALTNVSMPNILIDWQEIPTEAPPPEHEIEFHAVARY